MDLSGVKIWQMSIYVHWCCSTGDNLTTQRKSINHLPELKNILSTLSTPGMFYVHRFFQFLKMPQNKKKTILYSILFYVVLVCTGLCVVFTIPSKYSIYLVWKCLKQYSIYSFVLFDSCVFQYFSRPVSKLAKNNFDREEKRVKTDGFEHIPTIFFFLKKSVLKMSDILSTPGRLYIYVYIWLWYKYL